MNIYDFVKNISGRELKAGQMVTESEVKHTPLYAIDSIYNAADGVLIKNLMWRNRFMDIVLKVYKVLAELRKYFKVNIELGQDDDPDTPEEAGLLATIKLYKKKDV